MLLGIEVGGIRRHQGIRDTHQSVAEAAGLPAWARVVECPTYRGSGCLDSRLSIVVLIVDADQGIDAEQSGAADTATETLFNGPDDRAGAITGATRCVAFLLADTPRAAGLGNWVGLKPMSEHEILEQDAAGGGRWPACTID